MHASPVLTAAARRDPPPDGRPPRQSLRIIVADADPAGREVYRKHLTGAGHDVLPAETGTRLVELCRAVPADLVLVDANLPDVGGVELAAAVCRERPVPVVLAAASPDAAAVWAAADCHVLGYLAKPVGGDALLAAVAVAARNFDRLRALRAEADQARAALEDRKLVERAKGAVVLYTGLSEDEAYRRMRRSATDRGLKLVEVARTILSAAEVFARLGEADDQKPPHPPADGQRHG